LTAVALTAERLAHRVNLIAVPLAAARTCISCQRESD